jgi:hypothetical protein
MNSSRDHLLSWGHYADGHRGLCLHFDKEQAPFAVAMKVSYVPDYPVLEFPINLDNAEMITILLLRKSPEWKYEQEFRLIRFPERISSKDDRDLFMAWDGQLATFSPQCLIGITLGMEMAESDRKEIIELASTRKPALAVFQAENDGNKFALRFEQVA